MHPLDCVLVQVVAEPERIRAGNQRANGRFLDAVGRADGGHLERVGDDQPVEAELAAQQSGQDRLAEARRRVVQVGHEQMAGHHGLNACGDRGAERQQRRVEVALDHRELAVRVGSRVAVSGEVLRAGRHALALRAGDERSDVTRDELWVGAEAAHADDGVQGIGVGVRDRGEIQVDARRGQLACDRACDRLGQRHVVDGAERKVAGVRAAVLGLEPRHVSALLVDRDQELGPLGAKGARQLGELPRIADVVGEEGDPAEPPLEPARDPVRDGVTGEARLQTGRSQAVELAHCLTAPAVRPKAIRLCTITKKITTGRAVSVAAAISVPQSTPRVVPVMKFASQIVIVCLSALESMT